MAQYDVCKLRISFPLLRYRAGLGRLNICCDACAQGIVIFPAGYNRRGDPKVGHGCGMG